MKRLFVRSINTLKEDMGNYWLFWNVVMVIMAILSIFGVADRGLITCLSIYTIWVDARTLLVGKEENE